MPKSFSFVPLTVPLRKLSFASMKDPRVSVRAALGTLLFLNIVAALILFKPWGGSADDLERQLASMRKQLPLQQAALAKTRVLVQKVESARGEGEQFMAKYMLNGRSTYSSIVGELDRAAERGSLKPKERQFWMEPIGGAGKRGMIDISATCRAAYVKL